MFHGLDAYRGTRKPLQQLQAAETALHSHLACATRPIGPIGIMVYGEVTDVFDRDVWSEVDMYGGRYPTAWGFDYASKGIIADSAELELWMKDQLNDKHTKHYCEAFVKPKEITHVWIKPWVGDSNRKVAKILARRYGAKLVTVEGHTRPWDVVGSYLEKGYYYQDYEGIYA